MSNALDAVPAEARAVIHKDDDRTRTTAQDTLRGDTLASGRADWVSRADVQGRGAPGTPFTRSSSNDLTV